MLTLALGIGASTAIFWVVNGVLLEPLPQRDPDRLLWISEASARDHTTSVSWMNYLDWRARARSFDALAASRTINVTLTGTGARLRRRRRAPRRSGRRRDQPRSVATAVERRPRRARPNAHAQRVTATFFRST